MQQVKQVLSNRQKEIMQLLMDGYTTKQIAHMCGGIAMGTVRVHIRNACKVLNAKTVIQCAAILAKNDPENFFCKREYY